MSLLRADARALPLAAASVQCVVTSPPYWGLRDYAIGGQLGLEATPDAYVAALVAVFRQVWRVLRPDGVLWLNLGDSYSMSTRGAGGNGKQWTNAGSVVMDRQWQIAPGLKPKDLCGIPWRVAFALQADGWTLRSDVIWSKPNPMPESVTDRPTKAHEYVFLLSKSQRYYWNADAVRERGTGRSSGMQSADKSGAGRGFEIRGGFAKVGDVEWQERNIRSVWSIATQPYAGAHFATMPEALARRCILAASRPGDRICDPFAGSGTVCRVALALGRQAVGCDLSRPYLALADERLRVTRGLPLDLEDEASAPAIEDDPAEIQGALW